MKSLNKTIESLIKIDPELFSPLLKLKNKFKRWPNKKESYWKELLAFLNTDAIKSHPKRPSINKIFSPKEFIKPMYTFLDLVPEDSVIGLIPENFADILRRNDLKSIKIAKCQTGATLTHNATQLATVERDKTYLSIESSKIWAKLLDHYNLWGSVLKNLSIKTKNGSLYLTQSTVTQFSGTKYVKMDSRTLKEFLRLMRPGQDS